MHDFGTHKISKLWEILTSHDGIDEAKAVSTYLRILMQLDFSWLEQSQVEHIDSVIKACDDFIWNRANNSKDYYRWQFAATDLLLEKIERGECEDLNWYKEVLPEHLQKEITVPSESQLKNKRLEMLKLQKEEAKSCLTNYSFRKAIIAKKKQDKLDQELKDIECAVM